MNLRRPKSARFDPLRRVPARGGSLTPSRSRSRSRAIRPRPRSPVRPSCATRPSRPSSSRPNAQTGSMQIIVLPLPVDGSPIGADDRPRAILHATSSLEGATRASGAAGTRGRSRDIDCDGRCVVAAIRRGRWPQAPSGAAARGKGSIQEGEGARRRGVHGAPRRPQAVAGRGCGGDRRAGRVCDPEGHRGGTPGGREAVGRRARGGRLGGAALTGRHRKAATGRGRFAGGDAWPGRAATAASRGVGVATGGHRPGFRGCRPRRTTDRHQGDPEGSGLAAGGVHGLEPRVVDC